MSADAVDDIVMYATSWCGECRRAKALFDSRAVPFRWVDIEDDPEAAERVMQLSGGYRSVPTITFPDGTVLVEPTSAELSAKLAGAGGIVVYRKAGCQECDRITQVLTALGVTFRAVDVHAEPQAAARVRALASGFLSVPTVVLPDGSALVEPSIADLATRLGA
jgi:mycoredoxin